MINWFKTLNSKQSAILALIIANTIWGAASPIFKWALFNIPLYTLAFFRFYVASLILIPFVWKKDFTVQRNDIWPLIGLSIMGITVNIIFFFQGLKNAPSINAPIIASSGPIFLLIASILLLHERPQRKTIIGTLISLLGVLVIVARPLWEQGFDVYAVLGNVYFLIATIGAVGHILISKTLIPKYSALILTFWSFVIGSLTFFPFFAYETWTTGLVQLDIRGITGLIFGIFLSSALAYFLYVWAVGKVAASEVGMFTYIDPVIATIIAIPLLHETVTPLFLLGSIFVFLGIFYAEGRLHWHPFHQLKRD